MSRTPALRGCGILLLHVLILRPAAAAPPGPGECFNGGDPHAGCVPPECAAFTSCGANVTGCVSPSPDRTKCAVGIGKAFSKALASAIKCHEKQAGARFKGVPASVAGAIEETCELGPSGKSVREKLDAGIQRVAPLCESAQLSNAAAEADVLFRHPAPVPGLSLDALNAVAYCDSTAGAEFIEEMECAGGPTNGAPCEVNADCGPGGKCLHEDLGWVPRSKDGLKCADTLGNALAKLTDATIRCHGKMNAAFYAGKDFDVEACEEFDPVHHRSARERFNAVRDKTHATIACPACLDPGAWDDQAANSIGTIDGGNIIAFPCLIQ